MLIRRITLSPRLAATASLVVGGGNIVDVGTDHAYLPAHLILTKKIPFAIASDVRRSPLDNARDTVIKYKLQNKVDLRLSDGLKEISPDEVEEIVFAGMGGTLIAEKLKECSWVKSKKHHFIFQPQSKAEDLREYLYSNGFRINKELAVSEGNRYYITFDAYYTGEIKPFTLSDCFIGELPQTLEAKAHLRNQLNRLEKKYNALRRREDKAEEVKSLEFLIEDIKGFIYG
ncbi:MAG: SAM-dependent methyltransferase [Ruminococcaceae bacterium]|nr:SAM-dependent methyltransferase [Oscillospiraceae bacterium]